VNLKADDVRLHVSYFVDDSFVTAGHVSQLGGTVQVFARFNGVVRQNVVRRQTKLCSAIRSSNRAAAFVIAEQRGRRLTLDALW